MWNKPPPSQLSQLSTIKEVCVCVCVCIRVCLSRAPIPAPSTFTCQGATRAFCPFGKKKGARRSNCLATVTAINQRGPPPSLSLSLFLVRSRYRRLEMQKRLWKSNRITLFFWDLIKSSSLTFEPKGDIFSWFLSLLAVSPTALPTECNYRRCYLEPR